MGKALPLSEIQLVLLERFHSALAIFDVDINSYPIQKRSVVRPEGFGASKEPSVLSLCARNAKSELTSSARA